MSFGKAEQLIELATLAAGRYVGVTIDDVIDRFGCSKRTAQRMLHALESRFLDTATSVDDTGRKRWRLPHAAVRDLLTVTPDEMAALELAIEFLTRTGQGVEASRIEALKEKVLALVPRSRVVRLETDYEALLEAQGLAARPGPRPRTDPAIMAAISEAIKACRLLDIVYQGRADEVPRNRRIAPLGVLIGLRRYLVARLSDDREGRIRLFRADGVLEANILSTPFVRDTSFELKAFAARAFGSYQNEAEFGEVEWRFTPDAARQAREFEFHPNQSFTDEPDGSLIVRFEAAGHLEMCWHLYAWGDKVEVLKPRRLREMVHEFRRADFPALP